MERIFQKTLPDLIRGLRTQKTPAAQQKYIKECLNEIRDQVRSTSTKVEAVRKLGYLHMLGYDLSWAAFHVIEVMASSDLQSKKIGYAVAASAFKSSEEVWMLATNQIRKDLSSSQPQHVALALHFLATHLTPVLARDLFPEISRLLSHSRPYIRKRAVLVLWRVALCGGSDLGRESILKVREKLADSDQAVVATAVNVLCELARKNPKSYLPLAPQLYGLLVNSSNNWMSIKIVKLFSALTPHEPRLARKLVPHLEHIIETTSAMSLLYECLQTLILGQMIPKQSSSPSEDSATDEQSPTQTTQTHRLATLCATKLQSFITSTDQNLKYLGLHLLSQLFPLHPSSVLPHRATILACLSDRDISIRTVSLHIVINMITPATLPTITNHLLNTLESLALGNDEQYKALVLNRILDIIESDTYANVSDFEWLVEILLRISIIKIKMASVGDRVSRILIDVSARVDELRPFAVKKSLEMVQTVLGDSSFPSSFSNLDVLWGAMYIIGAYPSFLTDSDREEVWNMIVNPKLVSHGPDHSHSSNFDEVMEKIHTVSLMAVLKVFVYLASNTADQEAFVTLLTRAQNVVDVWKQWELGVGVQQVVSELDVLFSLLRTDIQQNGRLTDTTAPDDHQEEGIPALVKELETVFGELRPVASTAQKRIAVPDDLDLETWVGESFLDDPDEEEEAEKDEKAWEGMMGTFGGEGLVDRADRMHMDDQVQGGYQYQYQPDHTHGGVSGRDAMNPYYLSSDPASRSASPVVLIPYNDIPAHEIPIIKLDPSNVPLALGSASASTPPVQVEKAKSAKRPPKKWTVNRDVDVPVNVKPAESETIGEGEGDGMGEALFGDLVVEHRRVKKKDEKEKGKSKSRSKGEDKEGDDKSKKREEKSAGKKKKKKKVAKSQNEQNESHDSKPSESSSNQPSNETDIAIATNESDLLVTDASPPTYANNHPDANAVSATATLSPPAFATLLSTHHFPYTTSTRFTLPPTFTADAIFSRIAALTTLQIVEIVEASCTFATRVEGAWVVGLCKTRVKGDGKVGVVMELKGERGVVERMVEAVEDGWD